MNIRKIVIILSLILGMGYAYADDELTVRDVTVARNGKAILAIETAFESDVFFGYQLEVVLPKGLTITLNSDGKPTAESYTALDIVGSVLSKTSEYTTYQFVATKMGNPRIPAGNYVLLSMPIESDGTLEVGTVLECSVTNILFSDGTQTGKTMSNRAFTVTITDKMVLDENSPVVPMATDGVVDLLVKRTIKGGEWSTICLPFDMTEDDLYDAFGNDVQLAEFDTYEVNDDGGIEVNFYETDMSKGLYANWPYLIMTSADVTSFEVTAEVKPHEDEAIAEYETGKGKNKRTVGTFTGTLHAGTVIPADNLFLNGNNFHYSVGKTRCKAFRAYFWFEDVLSDVENASSRISFFVEHDMTGISKIQHVNETNNVFDLQGRHVVKPAKGIYVKDGKKVIIK